MRKGKFFLCLKSYNCVIDTVADWLNEDPDILYKNDQITFLWE